MIRYRYNDQFTPPAALVLVTLRSSTGKEFTNVPAQLDTAADLSVLPGKFVTDLGLVRPDEILVVGVGGEVLTRYTYVVEIQIHDLAPVRIEAASDNFESLMILGRDVLNHFRILLDGPEGGVRNSVTRRRSHAEPAG